MNSLGRVEMLFPRVQTRMSVILYVCLVLFWNTGCAGSVQLKFVLTVYL